MNTKTIHDIHKDYVNSGVSLVKESQWLENKELLQELLTELSQEYVKTVFGTVEKIKISAEEAAERDLLSSQELKQKFFQDIAKETNIDVKVKNARQLVEALFSEHLEVPKERDEDVFKPRVLWTIENIWTIILPPDILGIVIWSWRGREHRETPLGFDKIGMVEERLSSKLSRERTTFHWKIGTLNDNQMRKTSYYHLYVPEFDKTLLLNNQYGEWAFVVEGNFNIREARKSDLKWSSEAVMIKFDYEHPEEFLERLGIELNKQMNKNNEKTPMISNKKTVEVKHTEETSNLWADGRVEIDGEIYQWVGSKTPSNQLWGIKGLVAKDRVDKKVKEDNQRWEKNIKQAKSKVWEVQVVKLSELEKLLKPYIELKELWADGKVEIDWEIYQWVGANTPIEQLRGMMGQTAMGRIQAQIKEHEDWWKDNIRKARWKQWKELQVVKLSELKKLIKRSAELKELWEDGRIEIEWDIYQWVGNRTPSNQLGGLNGFTVKRMIDKKIKEDSNERWKRNVRKAMTKVWEVQVVKMNVLEELLKPYIELKELWEDGRIEIEWDIYQWVWVTTPSNQLRWINGPVVDRKVKENAKEDSNWGEESIKKAKWANWREVQVVKLSELKKLLGKS